MGKQSARLIFRGKDHKDIYFQGKYCNALYVCKDDTTPELYWRKLYDEGYFVYTFYTYNRPLTNYYTAIMYPGYKIREYQGLGASGLLHTDKFFLAVSGMPNYTRCWISEDGKYWKRNELSDLGSRIGFIIPKWNGIVLCDNISSSGGSAKYTYFPVRNAEIDRNNSIMIYSDDEHGTHTSGTAQNFANISDVLILHDNTSSYNVKTFAVDINGEVHHDLFSLSYTSNYHANGCLNGLYWVIDIASSPSADGKYNIYAYTAKNPYGGEWEKKIIFSGSGRNWNCAAIQANDYVVLYFSRSFSNESLTVCTTKDFENLNKISIPDNLVVPIIGPTWDINIMYINIRLSPSAESRSDSLNYDLYTNDLSDDFFRNRLSYVENQKITPFKSMILKLGQSVGAVSSSNVTIYIDNLFFEESENNFAICEIYYPQEYMNDYIQEEDINNANGN